MALEDGINPFKPGGELSKEAEVILKRSTITRGAVIINDPDLHRDNGSTMVASSLGDDSSLVRTSFGGDLFSSPGKQTLNGHTSAGSAQPIDISGSVTCEVTAGRISPLPTPGTYEEQRVEGAKIKSKTKSAKCCVLQ